MTSWSQSGAEAFENRLHVKVGKAPCPKSAIQFHKAAGPNRASMTRDNPIRIAGAALLFPSTNLVDHS